MTKSLQRKIARVNKQGNDAGSALALIRSLAEEVPSRRGRGGLAGRRGALPIE